MRRKETEPLRKHIINLFDGDFEKLQILHSRLGASKAIRHLVRGHIKRTEERTAQTVKPVQIDPGKVELI